MLPQGRLALDRLQVTTTVAQIFTPYLPSVMLQAGASFLFCISHTYPCHQYLNTPFGTCCCWINCHAGRWGDQFDPPLAVSNNAIKFAYWIAEEMDKCWNVLDFAHPAHTLPDEVLRSRTSFRPSCNTCASLCHSQGTRQLAGPAFCGCTSGCTSTCDASHPAFRTHAGKLAFQKRAGQRRA